MLAIPAHNLKFIRCKLKEACIGHGRDHGGSVVPGKNPSSSPKLVDGCNNASGYEGVLCHTCTDNFTRWRDHGCKACVPAPGLVFAAGLLGMVIFVAYFVRRVKSANRRRQGLPKRREMELIKIMINGMYGMGALASFPLKFPQQMSTAFDVGRQLSSLSGEVLSAECLLETKDGDRFLRMQLIILIIPLAAIALAHVFGQRSPLYSRPLNAAAGAGPTFGCARQSRKGMEQLRGHVLRHLLHRHSFIE